MLHLLTLLAVTAKPAAHPYRQPKAHACFALQGCNERPVACFASSTCSEIPRAELVIPIKRLGPAPPPRTRSSQTRASTAVAPSLLGGQGRIGKDNVRRDQEHDFVANAGAFSVLEDFSEYRNIG